MSVQDLKDKRIDRYLTNFIQTYGVEDDVGEFIAPGFKVPFRSGKYLKRTKDRLRIYDTKISQREPVGEISHDADDATFTLEDHGLSTVVYDDDIDNQAEVVNLAKDQLQDVMDSMLIAKEKRVVDIAGSTTFVTQYTDKSDAWATPASATPFTDIKTGLRTIWKNSTKKANAVVMDYDVALMLTDTADWINRFKFTDNGFDKLENVIGGLRSLGLEPKIAGVFGSNTNKGGASDPGAESMWTDKVLIFHRQPNPTRMSNTFMFSPYTENRLVRKFRLEDRGTKGAMKYVIASTIDELLVNASCAYLITNVGA